MRGAELTAANSIRCPAESRCYRDRRAPAAMFPIRDEIPSRRAPVVTWALIAVNVAVFAYQFLLPEASLASFVYRFGLVPARITDPEWALAVGFPSPGYGSFLSSMFLHGGLLHLSSNMWTLWIFGDNVEDRMGRAKFLLFYIACGFAAGWIHWLFNASSTIPTVGASGAIAGVMGGYLLLYPHARVLTLIPVFFYPLFVRVPAIVYLGVWIVSQLYSGAMSLGQGDDAGGIAWWAHVGGFGAGVLLVKLLARREPHQLPAAAHHAVLDRLPASARFRHDRRFY
jgi:membrane associated rhomboid family serine protease